MDSFINTIKAFVNAFIFIFAIVLIFYGGYSLAIKVVDIVIG